MQRLQDRKTELRLPWSDWKRRGQIEKCGSGEESDTGTDCDHIDQLGTNAVAVDAMVCYPTLVVNTSDGC
jgi:hypothetical protein